MMEISEKNKVLVNRVIDTIDWTLIHKFYKLVGRSIGNETTQIPGIKKLARGVKLTEDHIKEEVLNLLNHIVENDISQFIYGPWNIIWVNGEWEIEVEGDPSETENPEDGEGEFIPLVESVLEVYFSPMVIISREVVISEDSIEKKEETRDLERDLKKALVEENYELASRIRDLIDIYNKQK
jgi:hypothetical protein